VAVVQYTYTHKQYRAIAGIILAFALQLKKKHGKTSVSLHYCYIGFAGAAPRFNSIGPYWFQYRFIDEYFVF
jgi:hypothetical protein